MLSYLEELVQRISFLEIAPPKELCEEFAQELTADGTWHSSQAMTPSSTVRLIHQSAKDYILGIVTPFGDETKTKDPEILKFDDSDIAGLCVTLLKARDFATCPVRDWPEEVLYKDRYLWTDRSILCLF